uniref:EF-hand domain-containing protein n=1 Tax=uncultured Candidatus Melainabacteria bacterium TaxID=2682970 RepID=A0A650EK93_9BACT|nr:hypothetical protein Melaina855_2490 [uncultured Candidatus Melainabacteria bacterium]
MVNGVGKNQNNYPDMMKLKGTDKSIDLKNLTNLQRTEQNKAIFDMCDHNKDGKIDEKEAQSMRGVLLNASKGDGVLTKKEANKLFGKQQNAFDAISSLADQQKAISEGVEYKEVNGNLTTRIYQSKNGDQYSYRCDQTTNEKGTTTSVLDDGTQEIRYKDGSKQTIGQDGTVIFYDSKGNKSKVIQNGLTTTFTPDGNKSITKNENGQTVRTAELRNNEEVRTEYEYKDGNSIGREYTGSGSDAKLTSIVVSGREKNPDGTTGTIETRYNSEEDMTNNHPVSAIKNKGLPTETTISYNYDSQGNKMITETDQTKVPTTTFQDKDGNKIDSNQYDAPQPHTVTKGETVSMIVKKALADQGIPNPTKDQLKDATEQFLEMNKDVVKTYNGPKTQFKGNKYFYPNDQVNIPNFQQSISNVYLNELEVVTTKPSDEMIAKRKDLQAKLGDEFEVEYAKDGKSLEVRNKNGDILPEATRRANGQESNEDDINLMMASDADGSKTLDKTEYHTFITEMLQEAGIEITDANKNKIDELINNSFTSMDTIQKDGVLSKEELTQNAQKVIEQLTDNIGNIDETSTQTPQINYIDNPTEIKDNNNFTLNPDEDLMA